MPNGSPISGASAFLDIADLAHMLAVSRATIRRMVDCGRLPEPLRLTAQTHRWRRADIDAWLASLAAAPQAADNAADDPPHAVDGRIPA